MKKHKVTLVKGYQVASGLANDLQFLDGTISAQTPLFKTLGLCLDDFLSATLNVKFNCQKIELSKADYSFQNVKWHSDLPAEDFKFFSCQIWFENTAYNGFIYQPQIKTKVAHFQPENQLELLAPHIKNITYGDTLQISSNSIVLHY